MIAIHKNPLVALQHPSTWLGFAGIAGTTATQLPDPHKTHCYMAAGLFSAIGTLLKTPTDDSIQNTDPQPTPTIGTANDHN